MQQVRSRREWTFWIVEPWCFISEVKVTKEHCALWVNRKVKHRSQSCDRFGDKLSVTCPWSYRASLPAAGGRGGRVLACASVLTPDPAAAELVSAEPELNDQAS